jgi:alpha-glucosidase
LNLYRRMLNVRRELDLGRGSLAWAEEWCTASSLAFLNGDILVVMNMGPDSMDLPAGEVVLRSSPAGYSEDGHRHGLSSGETVWLRIPAEGIEN